MKSAIYLVLLVLLVGLPGHATETALIDFELKDQFKRSHRDDDWRGNVLLLIGSDEKGSQFDLDWKGRFATAYGFEGDKANILVFDRKALLRHQLAVAGIDSQKLGQLVDVVDTLLGRPDKK